MYYRHGRSGRYERTSIRVYTPRRTRKRTGAERCAIRACYVLSSIKVMNRFSHVDLAAPPFPPLCGGGGKGGTLMPVIAGARCAPPAPPRRGGQGGRLHCARVNDRRARRRRAPPLSPPCGGAGGAIASCARQRSPRAAQARPPFPPLRGGRGGRGGRSKWSRCGASSVMKVREGARRLSRSKRRRPAPRRSHRWDRVDVSY